MCNEETARLIRKIEQAQTEIESNQKKIENNEKQLIRMERSGNVLLNDVAHLLREQATNNLDTSKLLSDLSD